MPASPYMDIASFHKLWSALPANRCDRGFWNGMESLCAPFLDDSCPLRSQEYFSVPHTGRVVQQDLHFIDGKVVAQGNDLRMLYDAFTLWNPFALAALLKTPISVVIEQLLLAVEYNIMVMRFVVSCRSCAFDLKHFTNVSEVPFHGTYHTRNAFRCPMCTDRTDVNSLSSVSVFFQLQRLHPIFQRAHHRSFVTEEAHKKKLESFFCPSNAGFAMPLYLPRGKFLLCAPFMAGMVELNVEVSAEAFDDKDPFLPRIIDLKNYCVEPASSTTTGKLKMGGGQRGSGMGMGGGSLTGSSPSHGANGGLTRGRGAAAATAVAQAYGGFPGRRSLVATQRRRPSQGGAARIGGGIATMSNSTAGISNGRASHPGLTTAQEASEDTVNAFGAQEIDNIAPTQSLVLKHGKVQLRVYNTTPNSGFMDLYIKFDRCTEFAAVKYPKQFTLPDLLHCIPRGLRSRHLVSCTPLPPSETPTRGVFVRHIFDLDAGDFVDPQVLAVIREVHRYSLEDQHGLLLSVHNGGTAFESTFLSVTAALASSICFFQRVLVRLDESVATALRTSITEGPLRLAAYQGQYNDADNMRSAYPDVQFVGSVVYVSNHPPIVPPTLHATLYEAPTPPAVPRVGAATTNGMSNGVGHVSEFRTALHEEKFDLAMAAAAAKQAAITGSEPVGKSFMPWLDDADERGDGHYAASAVRVAADPFNRGPLRRTSDTLLMGDSVARRPRASVTGPSRTSAPNPEAETMVRFELRSVRRSLPSGGVSMADVRGGSAPLKPNYVQLRRQEQASMAATGSIDDPFSDPNKGGDDAGALGSAPDASSSTANHRNGNTKGRSVDNDDEDDDDVVLPYFLNYLVEQLEGTKIVEEPHALVVLVPMSVMHAAVQLSNMLDRSSYIKEYLGPF